jgi:uncharacterized phage-associated protein
MAQRSKAYSAENVANYFIYLASQSYVGDNKEKEGITNLKLQKILYFAQAYYLAKLNKPLFSEAIMAWEYGPVVPKIYRMFKHLGSDPIIQESDDSSIEEKDKEVLKKVWDSFGGYSATKLVNISHAHSPWKDAYKSESKKISRAAIAAYYAPLLNK